MGSLQICIFFFLRIYINLSIFIMHVNINFMATRYKFKALLMEIAHQVKLASHQALLTKNLYLTMKLQ